MKKLESYKEVPVNLCLYAVKQAVKVSGLTAYETKKWLSGTIRTAIFY